MREYKNAKEHNEQPRNNTVHIMRTENETNVKSFYFQMQQTNVQGKEYNIAETVPQANAILRLILIFSLPSTSATIENQ